MEIWDYLILFWYHCQRPKVIYLQIRIKLTPGAVFASFQFCSDSPRNSIEVNLLKILHFSYNKNSTNRLCSLQRL